MPTLLKQLQAQAQVLALLQNGYMPTDSAILAACGGSVPPAAVSGGGGGGGGGGSDRRARARIAPSCSSHS